MKNSSKSAFVPIVVWWTSLFVHVLGGFGATLQVPSQDYPTIQAAMNAASPGDTVRVGAGTYYETVVLSAGVALEGSGRDMTIIDGRVAEQPVVRLEDDPSGSAAVRGLTVQNGVAGVFASNSRITLSDNRAVNNRGPGIAVIGGAAHISKNLVEYNGGSGVRTHEASATITDNEVRHNHGFCSKWEPLLPTAPFCGGIQCNLAGETRVLRNTVRDNQGCGVGGIGVDLLLPGASCVIESNVLEDNSGGGGGGIYVGEWNSADPSRMVVQGNTLRNNQGGEAGGMFAQGFVEVSDNEVAGNSGVFGSGIFYRGATVAWGVMRGNVVYQNQCTGEPEYRAAVYVETAIQGMSLEGNSISENTGSSGLRLARSAAEVRGNIISGHDVGGIRADSEGQPLGVEMIGNTVRDNEGSGVSLCFGTYTLEGNVIEGNWADWHGGAIYCEGSDLTLARNTIRRNGVRSVGQTWIVYVVDGGDAQVIDNTISDNDGNGLCVVCEDAVISSNRIERNTYDGISSWVRVKQITGNLVRDNGRWGCYVNGDGALIANNVVASNGSGLGVEISAETADIVNNTVVGNQDYGLNLIGWAQPRSPVRIHNNILWGNGLDLDLYPWWAWWEDRSVDLLAEWSHNLFVTGGDYVGAFPLSADPLLADWPNGDFHLLPGSPCIDAGLTEALPADLTSDFYGKQRVVGQAVDIGAAEFPLPALSFSVRTATAKFFLNGNGRVALWADLDMPMPPPTDVLSLDFDGVRLFSVPFSVFRPGALPRVYVQADKGLIVQLDFATHRLCVHTPKMPLPGVDNADGVDVRFQAGSMVGEENIVMRELLRGQRWVYVRSGLIGPPPEVD